MKPRALLLGLALAGCVVTHVPKNASYLARAEEHYLREEYSRAAGFYELYLSDNPEDPKRPEVLAWLGKCQLGAGRADAALRAFDQALGAKPPVPLRCEVLFRRAIAFRMKGDVPKALEAFREVSRAPAPDRDRALTADELHYEHAIALFRAGDWKAGQGELTAVSEGGAYGAKARTRRGLASFTVQLGAFSDEARARAQGAGLPGASVRPVVGDLPLYVVTSGTFARHEEAQREADRLRGQGYPDAFVIP
jgi:tetratricopeptide (TPR) repeat protein